MNGWNCGYLGSMLSNRNLDIAHMECGADGGEMEARDMRHTRRYDNETPTAMPKV